MNFASSPTRLEKAIGHYNGEWPDPMATHILWIVASGDLTPAIVKDDCFHYAMNNLPVGLHFEIVCTKDEFETACKPTTKEPETDFTGTKHDDGKLRYSLVPPISLAEIVGVLTFGAKKYAPNNWQKIDNAKERYTDALYRHIEAYRAGKTIDKDSGYHNLACAGCCILFLLWFELKGKNNGN